MFENTTYLEIEFANMSLDDAKALDNALWLNHELTLQQVRDLLAKVIAEKTRPQLTWEEKLDHYWKRSLWKEEDFE